MFLEQLPHVEGKWKSRTIHLEPWQCFFVTAVFGWLHRETGMRRFRKVLIVVPRKNAKTTICAGLALYMLAYDGEPGAQIVSAATTKDQAKLSWGIAHRMASRSPGLLEATGMTTPAHSITMPDGSYFRPLSRDADSLEGLNIHAGFIDELHAHGNREVYDVLNEATGARSQPLMFAISTEGDSSAGVFADEVAYLQAVLSGAHDDPGYFGLYYSIDSEDDWRDSVSWRKANPNYGVSVREEDFIARARQASQNPASQSSFLTKRLNVRVGAAESYFNILAWKSLCFDPSAKIEDFYGKPCWITLDLASKWDLAAKVYLFERGGLYYAFSRCYLPESATEEGKPNYDIYRGWMRANQITITPGNVTDYAFIQRDLIQDMRTFQVTRIGYDPWNATQFVQQLQEAGIRDDKLVEIPPTAINFNEPMKEIAALVMRGKVKHDGDPVLTYAMGNVQAKVDARDNVYPVKARAENKIDAAVALIAAMSLVLKSKPRFKSVYGNGARM